MCRPDNILLDNQRITEEIEEKLKKILQTNENKRTKIQKPMESNKNNSKWEFYSNTSSPQQTKKLSNKQPNLTPRSRGTKHIPKLVKGKKL